MKKILVAFDFSEEAVEGLKSAYSLAKKQNFQITLAYVVEKVYYKNFNTMGVTDGGSQEENIYFTELMKRIEDDLESVMKSEEYAGIDMSYVIHQGKVYESLCNIVEEQNIDLLIMGSKGSKGLKGVFIGSNAETMSRYASCPVLIVKQFKDLSNIQHILYPSDLRKEQASIIGKVKELQEIFGGAHLHLLKVFDSLLRTQGKTLEEVEAFAKEHNITNYTANTFNHYDESEGVLEFALSVSVDVIILGTHGRKGLSYLFGHAVAKHVVNQAQIPVCALHLNQ